MTPMTGNSDPQVIAQIENAINLAANEQLPAAVQLLTRLAAEFPRAASVQGYLGWFLAETGQYPEAIEHTQEAVALSPESERASLVHFHILWTARQRTEAIEEMRRFLKIRPSEEYAAIARDLGINLAE